MNRAGSMTCGIWNLMPPKSDSSLSHLFEQARQSSSNESSPAKPLILNDIKDLGRGLN